MTSQNMKAVFPKLVSTLESPLFIFYPGNAIYTLEK